MKWYSDFMMAAVDADKTVVCQDGCTYIGRMDRSSVDLSSSTPVEQQPVWQIRQVQETTSGTDVIYTTKYPDGDKRFAFRMSDCKTLTYNYSLS